jgi:ABC-type tungstate transport system permease subunit
MVAVAVAPAAARADSAGSLTVVGTSDVSDSGLIANLIQPDFTKAYPQFTFKYIGTATGTAIADAESGSVGASALIVHAASLENQFVAGGYSYNNQYGYAIFTNDFVLAGPQGDPAGVAANGANNAVQAFEDVAAAGINGKATFVSRGGTPGTTVEEHKLWADVAQGSAPSGLLLCAVNTTNGGGDTPIASGNGVTASGQPCPNGGALPTGPELPTWYVTTGLTQGPNVQNANACNGYPSGQNSCYVLTDRGTYDYLASGSDPAGSIPGLKIVTRGPQSASAPGGVNALINYFHAYVINPSKSGESVNLTAAQDFINLLTSHSFQAQLSTYLAKTTDPAGAPFIADASPNLTATGLPRTYKAGKPVTISGTLTNVEPGYPALANETVTIDEIEAGVPVAVASGKTSATGTYSISFSPTSTGSYEVSTGQISQVENSMLSPVFGDLLSPSATAPSAVTVHGSITRLQVKGGHHHATVSGSVAPGSGHVKATVTVFARKKGSKHGYAKVGSERLNGSNSRFSISVRLSTGSWQLKVTFADPKAIVSTTSGATTVAVT